MKAALLAGAVLLTGCATQTSGQWHPDAALLTLCDPTGPLLAGGTGKDILLWGVEMRQTYAVCAAKHKRLVEAIPKSSVKE